MDLLMTQLQKVWANRAALASLAAVTGMALLGLGENLLQM